MSLHNSNKTEGEVKINAEERRENACAIYKQVKALGVRERQVVVAEREAALKRLQKEEAHNLSQRMKETQL